jgi:hypothetical protein
MFRTELRRYRSGGEYGTCTARASREMSAAGSQLNTTVLCSSEGPASEWTVWSWFRFAEDAAHLPGFSQWLQQGWGVAKQAAQGPLTNAASNSSAMHEIVMPRIRLCFDLITIAVFSVTLWNHDVYIGRRQE